MRARPSNHNDVLGSVAPEVEGMHAASAISDGATPTGHIHVGISSGSEAPSPHQSPPKKLKIKAAYAVAKASSRSEIL